MSQTGSHDQLQQPIMTKEMTIALFRLMLWGLGVESNRTRSHCCCAECISLKSEFYYALFTEDFPTDNL